MSNVEVFVTEVTVSVEEVDTVIEVSINETDVEVYTALGIQGPKGDTGDPVDLDVSLPLLFVSDTLTISGTSSATNDNQKVVLADHTALTDARTPLSHTHDDRYYTETETDTLLSAKASTSHTHNISDVTGLQTALDNKAAASHTHDDRYYTETEVDTLLTGKADTNHTHSISAITNLQTTLDDKASITGSYSNPSWITGLAWSKVSSTPTTLSGYGITDAVPSSRTITINGVSYDLSENRSFTVSTDESMSYVTNNIDKSSTKVYAGKSKSDGTWYIVLLDKSVSPTSVGHATSTNNPSYSTYTAAWSARTSLTYERYDQAF